MSATEEERPTGSIAQAAAEKMAAALPGAEEEPPPEAEDTEAPAAEAEPDDAAEEAADEAEADLPDDATEEEIEEARAEAREQFYAGTYKTREEAEKGIEESALTIKRLDSERNYLKNRLQAEEEKRQVEAEAAAKAEEIDVPAWDQWAQEAVEAGAGAQGALDALTEGGYEGYQLYLRHWLESGEDSDRAAATLFNNEVMLSMTEARAAAAASAARAEPTAAEQEREAHRIVQDRRPDFDEWAAEMQEAVEQLPVQDAQYLRALALEGAEGKARALDHIYLEARARGRTSPNAQTVERSRRKVSGEAARVAASSPGSEGTPSRTPPPATEQEGLRRKAEFRARMNLTIPDEE